MLFRSWKHVNRHSDKGERTDQVRYEVGSTDDGQDREVGLPQKSTLNRGASSMLFRCCYELCW